MDVFIADFGLEKLGQLVAQTSFPWLMSNVVDIETGRQLADGRGVDIAQILCRYCVDIV